MKTDTATVWVPRRTRDLFADQAHSRGGSLSPFLSDLAERFARE